MAIASLSIAALIVIIDQVIKLVVVNTIKVDGQFVVIENLLKFVYVENRGAAFGMLSDMRYIFIILTIIIVIVLTIMLFKHATKNKLFFISAGLIIGGGIGNLIDRIYLGYVVDYISVSFFPPVFNFADAAVVIGVALFAFYAIFKSDLLTTKKPIEEVAKDNE